MALRFNSAIMALALAAVGLASPCPGQSSPAAPASPDQDQERPAPSPSQQLPDHQAPGSVSGTIVDQSGAVVPGARVKLTHEDQSHQGQTQTQTQPQKDQSPALEVVSGDNGQFSFTNVTPGAFQLTVTAAGFASQTPSGILHPGETLTVPQIALAVAANVTDVQVSLSRVEVAEEQIKDQEKQRVLGVFPNFYVTYDPHPVALTSKQKFELAWKTTIDPVTFVIVGGIAGIQQAENSFGGYGQGAEGYAKRYGASYADLAFGTFLGSAIFPSLLKQDPRYFYKGTGSIRSRSLYAIANAVICKGDNGRWQVNYSNILGNLAAGGISNLYYPSQNRNGAGLTFENAVIGIGATAAANLVEEFLMRKLTPNLPKHNQPKPEGAL